ncbi:riboflavin biosynthesis protein RibF [Parvularcula bermudensis HTCC2503]|uniref:Riboflavin biosynthesis protein n=1 Tax=Parvularcula bermudensis (strain ATCC BAA-594 / HTCC2503 / KCTC 12087) TaxID=314260 RepID=E0TCL8_PARBH|nr:bifunctional riboflavin kinase/FAD synthetase [Parvularcula bermudensis]ADM08607.1 riboflavin biosynthesis protein RibF [Parvularcula bermudensis HTCC2503]
MTIAEVLHAPLECDVAAPYRGAVSVIGNLDGVHRGHQALIGRAKERAEAASRPLAVTVFDPHPRRVFSPEGPPFLLTKLETKAEILGSLGVDYVFVLPFNDYLRTQTPETFVRHTLAERLGLHTIITGTDFRFGAGRSGDCTALARHAAASGMQAEAISPVLAPGTEKYSSSGIRAALQAGDPQKAARWLGRPWSILGTVEQGRQLARTLDFPTANISLGPYVRPKFGVYATSTLIDGERVPGVANIGVRPTVDGTAEWLEVHLFDVAADLYGRALDTQFLAFLRPEQKFDGIDALKAQIATDGALARNIHAQS